MEPIAIEGPFLENETSLWNVAGYHLATQLMNEQRSLSEPGVLGDTPEDSSCDESHDLGPREEAIDPFEYGAETYLLWDVLGETCFALHSGYSLPLSKIDPASSVTWEVRLSQLDPARVADVFGLFCGWLTDWTDPNDDFPFQRPSRGVRQRLGVRYGRAAWDTPWVDHLGFARWAWSKGLLREGAAWEGLKLLDPYVCGLLERPSPRAPGESLTYFDRVRLGLEG